MHKDHFEIILEDIREKFDLVLEGHGVLHKEIRDTREDLGERIQRVDFKVDALTIMVDKLDQKVETLDKKVETLNDKIDAVAADLTTHRRDTEAHPSVYKVKENP